MSRPDWDCSICSQPNGADDGECINCGCPYSCPPEELALRKEAYTNAPPVLAPGLAVATATEKEEPFVPSSKYLRVFPPVPTLYHSTLVFAAVYFAVLAVAIPLALAFKPDTTSSVCYGAIIGGAIAIGEYWKRCNMLSLLRNKKWAMTWSCLGVTLVADLLAFVFGIDIWNMKFSSSMLFQKIGHIVMLWLTFGTNWFVSMKVRSQSAKTHHAP